MKRKTFKILTTLVALPAVWFVYGCLARIGYYFYRDTFFFKIGFGQNWTVLIGGTFPLAILIGAPLGLLEKENKLAMAVINVILVEVVFLFGAIIVGW